jgi:hypothetical protein
VVYARGMHISPYAKLMMIIPISVVIYFGIMFILGTFKKKEIEFLMSFLPWRKIKTA